MAVHDRAGGGHSCGGGGRRLSWALAGSSDAHCRAGRLFDAGLLAGAARAFAVLREARLGAGAGSDSISFMRIWCHHVTGVILIDAADARETGRFGGMRFPT